MSDHWAQVAETEGGREALRTELENVRRNLASVEEEYQKRCGEFEAAVAERDVVEQQAAVRRRDVERAVETTNTQLAAVRVELEAAHGRLEALQGLSCSETDFSMFGPHRPKIVGHSVKPHP